ncbi:NLR family CARD domain-containing protein 4-like [Apostichopus japonicus]|uniref:NLR family CARD domain-containing protein 4-like n=1 Tax=Stichopus japonicus TaxID=307972 RepID=UPI003AB5B361
MASDLAEKKRRLISSLKSTYTGQYNAVQPIPYIRDRLYCVDKVFVEGSVHFLVAGVRGQETSWERLESYKRIYSDRRIKSTRRILEGEPGYGKSTVTLQLAYDWCNGVQDSPFGDVEILILLRLRQVGGVKSIYRAINRFLASGSRLSDKDIEDVLKNTSSVEILLDGYDEYPDQDKITGNDVRSIIMREMFPNHDVTLTTRYLPKKFPKLTKRVKLTGFDDDARDEYLRKAVVGNDQKALKQIKQRLRENPILADLCQVPLFFVMFAHIAHENQECKKFKSVTRFFKYMITCFHEHMRNKTRDDGVRQVILKYESEHDKLNKLAYEGLSKEDQQIVWKKDEMVKRVGQEFYDQYVGVGILVEEQVLSDNDTAYTESFTIEVRFYHKIFCEFYASYRLMLVVLRHKVSELGRFLGRMDPFDLQYLYRFACGLNPTAGAKIIQYLKSIKGGDKFAILCILEQTGKVDDIKHTVRDLCSETVTLNGPGSYNEEDSRLLQRSTIQLLEIAARYDIPISCVYLVECSPRVDKSGLNLVLQSGLSLSILRSLQKLWIGDDDRRLTNEELAAILSYSSQCTSLKELEFFGRELLDSVPIELIPSSLKSRNVKVYHYNRGKRLNFQTGRWEDLNSDYFKQFDKAATKTQQVERTSMDRQRTRRKCTIS